MNKPSLCLFISWEIKNKKEGLKKKKKSETKNIIITIVQCDKEMTDQC